MDPDTTEPAETRIPARSYLYQLVADGYDSSDQTAAMRYILGQRKQTPPIPYYVIAQALSTAAGHTVTHETCRRWVKTTTGQDA